MKPVEFRKYLDRDNGECYHCGTNDATLVPQHRIGRGMGGSKSRNQPSNVITFCSYANGLLESNAEFAALARTRGWKLESWQDTTDVVVFHAPTAQWWLLDDNYGRMPLFID